MTTTHTATTTTTWAEEDAGRWLVHVGNPDGYCPNPCAGVGVLHPTHA